MLHSCAEYLTHTLYRHCPLSEEKRPVFVYETQLKITKLRTGSYRYKAFCWKFQKTPTKPSTERRNVSAI